MIKTTLVPNIFSPYGRTSRYAKHTGGSLASYLSEELQSDKLRAIVSSRGNVDFSQWESTALNDGDEVIVTPVLGDTGFTDIFTGFVSSVVSDDYTIMRIMAGFGPWYISIGAMLLMNAMGPSAPSYGKGTFQSSPTYAFEGAQSMANQGVPVPIIYGNNRLGGNCINAYTATEGNDNYLYMLVALGEGEFQSIAGIESDTADWVASTTIDDDLITVDGNPIRNLKSCYVQTRMGTDTQSVILGLHDLHHLVSNNSQLYKDDPIFITTETADTEAAGLNFTASKMFKAGTSGYKEVKITAKVYYKEAGVGDPAVEGSWTYADTLSFTDVSTAEVRRSLRIPFPSAGKWDIRIIKTTQDNDKKIFADFFISSIDEIRSDDLSYPHTALLGLKLLATNQLNGPIPEVIAEVEGRKIDVYAGTSGDPTREYSRNPIWCMWDILTDARAGLGNHITSSDLDLSAFLEMADYCEELVRLDDASGYEERFLLDLVIDQSMGAMDILSAITQTCRCWLVWTQGAIRPLIDKDETSSGSGGTGATQLFTMGSIVKDSFSETFASLRNSFNTVEIQFINSDNDWLRDTIEIQDDDIQVDGVTERKRELFLAGVTRESQVTRIGRYMLNLDKYLTRTISFRAPIHAVACQAGDIINFAHNVPQWGIGSGRVRSSTANTITLDYDVTLPALSSGQEYRVQVRKSDDSIEELSISDPAGTYAAGYGFGVSSTWTTTPVAYNDSVVGISDTVVKPFRIVKMTRENDGEVTITAIEYQEEVYNDTGNAGDYINYTNLPDPRRLPQHVTNLQATMTSRHAAEIVLSWSIPDADVDYGFHSHAEVWISRDEGNTYSYQGTDPDGKFYLVPVETPGIRHYFKVIAVSKWGMKANAATAPTISILPLPDPPAMVRGLEIRGQGNDWQFYEPSPTFIWRERGRDGYGKELDNDFGAGAGVRGSFFSHYDVEILSQLREPKYTTVHYDKVYAPLFQYLFDMNRQDHGDYGPQRSFRIRVRAADIFNQVGPWAWLDAYNLEAEADESSMRFNRPPEYFSDGIVDLGYEPPPLDVDIDVHILVGLRTYSGPPALRPFSPMNVNETQREIKIYAFGKDTFIQALECPAYDNSAANQNVIWFTWLPVDVFGQTMTNSSLWNEASQSFILTSSADVTTFESDLTSIGAGGWISSGISFTSGTGSYFAKVNWYETRDAASLTSIADNPPGWYGKWRPVD